LAGRARRPSPSPRCGRPSTFVQYVVNYYQQRY
jgi:hypothetical protein